MFSGRSSMVSGPTFMSLFGVNFLSSVRWGSPLSFFSVSLLL